MGCWGYGPFQNDYVLDDIGGLTVGGAIYSRLNSMLDDESDLYDSVYEASAVVCDAFGRTNFVIADQEKLRKAYELVQISVEDGFLTDQAYNAVYESLLTVLSACQLSLDDRIELAKKALDMLLRKTGSKKDESKFEKVFYGNIKKLDNSEYKEMKPYIDKMIAELNRVLNNQTKLENLVYTDTDILNKFGIQCEEKYNYNVPDGFFTVGGRESGNREYRLTFGKNNRSHIIVSNDTFKQLKNQGKIKDSTIDDKKLADMSVDNSIVDKKKAINCTAVTVQDFAGDKVILLKTEKKKLCKAKITDLKSYMQSGIVELQGYKLSSDGKLIKDTAE